MDIISTKLSLLSKTLYFLLKKNVKKILILRPPTPRVWPGCLSASTTLRMKSARNRRRARKRQVTRKIEFIPWINIFFSLALWWQWGQGHHQQHGRGGRGEKGREEQSQKERPGEENHGKLKKRLFHALQFINLICIRSCVSVSYIMTSLI